MFPAFLKRRDRSRPFFVMCHRKEPNKEFAAHPWHVHRYRDDVQIPDGSDNDYKSRGRGGGECDPVHRREHQVRPEAGADVAGGRPKISQVVDQSPFGSIAASHASTIFEGSVEAVAPI
ncbi:hypothetical protein JCM24511_02050 [Saitozyma sp. JCM 24511]|nr:hypothetical protein JCM24511_02050 [Saitozyma sp. JCM 24511]